MARIRAYPGRARAATSERRWHREPLVDVYGGVAYGPDRQGRIGFDTLQGNSSVIGLDGENLDALRRQLCERIGWPWVESHKWTCDEFEEEMKRMAACIAANDTKP